MSKVTDKLMWSIIESLNWDERSHNEYHAYDAIKVEFLQKHTRGTARKVNAFVRRRFEELDKAYQLYTSDGSANVGNFGSDDGFSDMMNHVIGMGEETFDAVMVDMKKLNEIDYIESFLYALPLTDGCLNDYV